MRVLILNNSGYTGLANVNFPIEVEVCCTKVTCISVKGSELIREGAPESHFCEHTKYTFTHEDYIHTTPQGTGKLQATLLNGNGYFGVYGINFPVTVPVHSIGYNGVKISGSELRKVGGQEASFDAYTKYHFKSSNVEITEVTAEETPTKDVSEVIFETSQQPDGRVIKIVQRRDSKIVVLNTYRAGAKDPTAIKETLNLVVTPELTKRITELALALNTL